MLSSNPQILINKIRDQVIKLFMKLTLNQSIVTGSATFAFDNLKFFTFSVFRNLLFCSEMDKDFACWKITADSPGYEKRKFAFMAHPYILNPATKAQALYYDNRC